MYDENAKRRNNRSARPAKLVAKSNGYHTIEDQDNIIKELRLFHLSEGGEKNDPESHCTLLFQK